MMEYTLKDKKTEISLLANELKKTQQEMEVLQTRIHSYEVIITVFISLSDFYKSSWRILFNFFTDGLYGYDFTNGWI